MKLRLLLLLGAFLCLLLPNLQAQKDTLGAYCNVFYVTSDKPDILPFSDQCFLADQYSVKDPTNFKALGPVEGSISLFTQYGWSMHFYLPNPEENERLVVSAPVNLLGKDLKMKPGTFFITLSDNRGAGRLDEPADNVDFATVSGNAKVLEYVPQTGKMPYAQYKLQMDLRFRKVDRSEEVAKLVGETIRLRMVVIIDPKLD